MHPFRFADDHLIFTLSLPHQIFGQAEPRTLSDLAEEIRSRCRRGICICCHYITDCTRDREESGETDSVRRRQDELLANQGFVDVGESKVGLGKMALCE